ncbi:MAG: hypothetical protein ACK5C0_08485 [Candidatus Kapaibacterium sp.]|jgi:hypothetical protein
MTVFIANTFLPRVRLYFFYFVIEIFSLLWFLFGFFSDFHYWTPLIVFTIFSLISFFDFKKDKKLFINELHFKDEKKVLEIVYFSGFCKKKKKRIPYELLNYSPSVTANRVIYGDYTFCDIWLARTDIDLSKVSLKDYEFHTRFHWGLGGFDQVEFNRILKKLSEVGTIYKS